jgi:hypothetical protein
MTASTERSRLIRRLAVAAAAAVAAAGAAAASAQSADLGRLFFTPQQRAELDKRRLSNAPAQADAPPVVREVNVTLNGYVGRSGGKTTTWVNGVPQYDSPRSQDPSRVPIESAGGRRNVQVGATIDTNRGEIRDVVEGEIRVHRADPRR